MKAINLGYVFEKYKGLWVTLTESLDTVISADKNPKRAVSFGGIIGQVGFFDAFKVQFDRAGRELDLI